MAFKLKAVAIKEIPNRASSTGFRMVSFSPIEVHPELKLNRYFNFMVKGSNFPFITIGKEYIIEIEVMEEHPTYGTSYALVSCPSIDAINFKDLSKAESFEILMDCTSSEKIANNILEAYPNFIEIILTEGKDAIDTKNIKGVGEVYLSVYARNLTEKYKYYACMSKYRKYKLDVNDCTVLYSRFINDEAIDKAMEEMPYSVLISLLGRPFMRVDKLILEVHPELRESTQRCEFCVLDVLRANEAEGSTRLHGNMAYTIIKEDYNVPELLPLFKKVCIESDGIYYDEETSDLSAMDTYVAEVKVSEFILNKLATGKELNLDYESYKTIDDFTITDNQLNALKNFCLYPVSILAGYSGSGKSASVKNLVRMIEKNGMTYALLSPTGKASKVLSESTGRPAYTIHRRALSGEIDCDVLIVDEFGMVSLDIMIMLINACVNEDMRVVFVGDPAQLASISLGRLFEDFILSEVIPTTMLTEIFRYKSNGSLFVATNLRNGNPFFNDTTMVDYSNGIYSVGGNYKFMETEEDDILPTVVSEYLKLIDKGVKQKDIMVLSPYNVGEVGTYNLNNSIQARVNPPKPREDVMTRDITVKSKKVTIIFRTDDVVINTKNDYKAISYEAYQKMKEEQESGLNVNEDDVADSFVVNGQTGVVRRVLEDGLFVQYEEELIFVSKAKLNHLLLGYAISVHKSQGSSVDYTINVVSDKHKRMLSRGLEYVACTRCRKAHVDIGSVVAFEYALGVVENDLRTSWQKDLLLKK